MPTFIFSVRTHPMFTPPHALRPKAKDEGRVKFDGTISAKRLHPEQAQDVEPADLRTE